MLSDELINKIRLLILTRELRKRKCLPKHVNLTKHAGMFFSSVSDETAIPFLDPSGGGAGAEKPNLALIKGLIEYLERHIYLNAVDLGHPLCQAHGIDGVASFPAVLCSRNKALLKARNNGFCEAIERHAWAKWWDDHDKIASISDITDSIATLYPYLKETLNSVNLNTLIKKILLVSPQFISTPETKNLEILIFFITIKDGGVVCAGGVGEKCNHRDTVIRVWSELFRHSYAVKLVRNKAVNPQTLYEKRIAYFATADGEQALEKRLAKTGSSPIQLPKLSIDAEIKHHLSDLFVMYRCLFEDQSLFMAGEVDKLCI